MALEIKGLQRIFKFKKDSKELVLSDPDSSLSVNEVMDFYRYKRTIGVKG